ncbi:MAG: hypothetical protein N3D18_09190 [Roseococcus sp.]|nr:hypothetical protein [Roseococcus sp.]
MAAATDGGFGAHLIRAIPGRHAEPQGRLRALAVPMARGVTSRARSDAEEIGEVRLTAGSAAPQRPPGRHRELAHARDLPLPRSPPPKPFVAPPAPAP